MKETELWVRMDTHLGRGYSRVWSAEHSLAELDGRTVDQALAAGLSAKEIWRAVWAALELPVRER
jgi:hypothetical protein